MKVLLVCAAGMSTSLLANKMLKAGDPGDTVDALSVGELTSKSVDQYDVILLGPQIRYKLVEIEALAQAEDIPVGVIEMRDYGMMDGKAVMDQARALVAQE